jgi:DNA-directed RNA polymerase specialized sigma subunit
MDEDTKKKHIDDHYHEWLPTIHAKAVQLHRKYPDRVEQPGDLHHPGMMGLMAAFKDFDPAVAKVKENNFITYANKKIEGMMQNHITGLHSHNVPTAFDPHFEQQTRDFARKQKNIASSEEPPAIPSAANKPHWEDE